MPNPTEQIKSRPTVVLSLRDLAELLIKHRGLHEGLYNLAFQFQIAVGAVGPSPEAAVPGAMLGVSGVGLEKVDQAGPHTVDAAVINPAPPMVAAKPKATAAPKKSSKAKAA